MHIGEATGPSRKRRPRQHLSTRFGTLGQALRPHEFSGLRQPFVTNY